MFDGRTLSSNNDDEYFREKMLGWLDMKQVPRETDIDVGHIIIYDRFPSNQFCIQTTHAAYPKIAAQMFHYSSDLAMSGARKRNKDTDNFLCHL
jgi:hypothetical protein